MRYKTITSARQLQEYCRWLAECPSIALDVEFVGESSYQPQLCLVQVAVGEQLAIIDPLTTGDLRPFWEVLTTAGHETVVHAGRCEREFCLRATGLPPAAMFDVQVAAGLVGIEYPAGYATLVSRLLGVALQKHETRTDWRRRPLCERQLRYALEDVQYLPALRNLLADRLHELRRWDWFAEEMTRMREEAAQAAAREQWREVSGQGSLEPRGLAILRELYEWREVEAQRRNQPPRRVLRDDLIVELARRGTADVQHIRRLRGMERRDLGKLVPEISARIKKALDLAEDECPPRVRRDAVPPLPVLGQFLFAALGSICREAQVAPALVGGPNDIRELLAYREGLRADQPPKLALGWRKELVGSLFDDLLSSRLAVRVVDPTVEHPLGFIPCQATRCTDGSKTLS
jgi:ribonuclease D